MDTKRFDRLGAWLGASDSRRTALRALGAGVLATGLSGLGLRESLAKKKKSLGATCKKTDDCKGKLLCKTANSQNSCYDQSQKRCCKKLGATCNDSCECCGIDVICNGHICDSA
jgi:hypothetical protein